MDDFSKYVAFKLEGTSSLTSYLTAKEDGLDRFALIRMLREVYGLSLDEAKNVSFKAETGEELEEYQGKHIEDFKKVLDDELGVDDQDHNKS